MLCLLKDRVCASSFAQSCPTLLTALMVAHQAPLSMGFFRQEYWSGLPLLSPGDLPNPGIELVSPVSPALQVHSLSLSCQGSPRTEYLHKLFGTLHRKLSMFVSIWSPESTHYYVFCTMTYNPTLYCVCIAQTVPALAIGSFQLALISLWNKSIIWVCVCVRMLNISLFSGTLACCRLISSIPGSSYGVGYFSKESWPLLLKIG